MLILITGTSGSGKSEYAEKICCELAGSAKKYYIATMHPRMAAIKDIFSKFKAVIMHCGREKALKR